MPKPRRASKRAKPKAKPKSPGLAGYAAATVRPHEVGSLTTRYRQSMVAELMLRYSKYVACAQSRNAQGVASKALRVYRRNMEANRSTESGKMWAYETRPIRHKELLRQRQRAGSITRKAADLSDEVEEVIDPMHPLVRLLATPNPLMSGQQFLEQIQLGVGLAGDAYAHMVWNGEPWPVELWSLAPQFVRPQPSRANMVESYVYGRGTENEKVIPGEEIVRFTQPNPRGDPFRGFGDLEKCLDAADLSVAFDQFRLCVIDNGAQPGLVVVAKNAGVEQRKQLEEQFNSKYGGVGHAGRTIVLTGECEIKPWGMTEKEVAFLNSELQVRETIANCHDIPVALLTLESAALATAKVAIPHWEQMGLKPRCDRIADTLNRVLVPAFGDDRLYVCFEEVVTKDMDLAVVQSVSLYTGNLVTKNEARALIEYDKVEGGDVFKSEEDQANAAALLAMQPKPEPGEEDDDEAPAKDEEEKPKEEAKVVSWSRTWLLPDALALKESGTPIVAKALPAEFLTLTEKQLESVIRAWFQTIAGTAAIRNVTAEGFDKDLGVELAASFKQAIHDPLTAIFTQGWNYGSIEVVARGGKAELLMPFGDKASKALASYEGKLSRSVSATLNDTLKAELAEGVKLGETVPQLTQRVQTTVVGVSGPSAERIARTETMRAFSTAREATWRESGFVWGKKWLLAPDSCAFCRSVAAQGPIELGADFASKGTTISDGRGSTMAVDWTDIGTPPLHPHCRCSLVMVMERPK